MNWAFPKKGDRRLVSRWLIEIVADPVLGVNPSKCKYGSGISYEATLPEMVAAANAADLNSEGTVFEEEYTGETWCEVARYNCYGERFD